MTDGIYKHQSQTLDFLSTKKGVGIKGVLEWYKASTSDTSDDNTKKPDDPEKEGWKTTPSTTEFDETNKYLWNCEQIQYDDNTTGSPTAPAMIAVYSKDGVGIKDIKEYYILTESSDAPEKFPNPPTTLNDWSESVLTPDENTPYLWNYEIISYTEGGPTTSGPACIGMYGNSITGTVDYYAATSTKDAPDRYLEGTTINTETWKRTIGETGQGETKPFVWNFERTTYSMASTKDTEPTLISSSPRAIESITEYYYKVGINDTFTVPEITAGDEDGTAEPKHPGTTGGWGTEIPELDEGQYLWNYEIIKYSAVDTEGKNLYGFTQPARVGYAGTNGSNGASLVVEYVSATSADTIVEEEWSTTFPTPQTNEYVFMRQKLSTSNTWSTPVQITANDGATPTIEIAEAEDGKKVWVINGEPTDISAEGQDGTTPTVEIKDGKWFINGTDTGQQAQGEAGKDGSSVEFVYYRSEEEINSLAAPTEEDIKDQPTGEAIATAGNEWYPSPLGITETWKYEYMSVRTKGAGEENWGLFSTPSIWSKWGEKGQDGDGVSYEYCRTTGVVPNTTDSTFTWTDEPLGVDETNTHEYVIQYKTTVTDGVSSTTASNPILWAKYGKDGKDAVAAVSISLSNDMDIIPANSNGQVNTTTALSGATTTATAYVNGALAEVTIDCAVKANTSPVTTLTQGTDYTYADNVFSLTTWDNDANWSSVTATFTCSTTVTIDGEEETVTATKDFVMTRMDAEPGKEAVDYYLELSKTQVDTTSNGGTITITAKKKEGTAITNVSGASGIVVQVSTSATALAASGSGDEKKYTYTYNKLASGEVNFTLLVNGTVWDIETLLLSSALPDFNVTASSYALMKDKDGSVKENVTLTAHLINLSQVNIQWRKDGGSWGDSTSTLTKTVSETGTYDVRTADGKWSDSVTIVEVIDGATGPDGAPAIVTLLTNPSMTFVKDAGGSQTSKAMVRIGSTNATYSAQKPTSGTGWKYTLTESHEKCSIDSYGTITVSNPNTSATTTIPITIKVYQGTTLKTTQEINIQCTIVKNGTDGQDGQDGQDGSDGTNGDTITTKYAYYRSNSATKPSTKPNGATMPTGWSYTPQALDSSNKYQHVSQCTVTNNTYGTWTEPVLWARYGADGKDGKDGSNGSDATVNAINVFKTLTSDGTKFGCFGNDGNSLYINANYINTGILRVGNEGEEIFFADINNKRVELGGMTVGDLIANNVNPNLCDRRKLQLYDATIFHAMKTGWHLNIPNGSGGLKFEHSMFEPGEEYVLSYIYYGSEVNYKVSKLGGHCETACYETKYFKVDGVDLKATQGIEPHSGYAVTPDINIHHKVQWHFKYLGASSSDSNLYIQFNRGITSAAKAVIYNIKIEKGSSCTAWRAHEDEQPGKNLLPNSRSLYGTLGDNARTLIQNSELGCHVVSFTNSANQMKDILEFHDIPIIPFSTYTLTFWAKGYNKGQANKTTCYFYGWGQQEGDSYKTYYAPCDYTYAASTEDQKSDAYIVSVGGKESTVKEVTGTSGDGAVMLNLNDDIYRKYTINWRITTPPENGTLKKHVLFRLMGQGTVSIYKPKLEIDSIATPWSDEASDNLPAISTNNNFSWVFSPSSGVFMYNGLQSTENEVFKIYKPVDGDKYQAYIKGEIIAEKGSIGGWTLRDTSLIGFNGSYMMGIFTNYLGLPYQDQPGGSLYTTNGVQVGNSGQLNNWRILIGARNKTSTATSAADDFKFGVDSAGKLYASEANISGTITSSAGYIGGWKIGWGSLITGTFADVNSFHMYSDSGYCPYDTKFGATTDQYWMLGIGNNFGVTDTGALYATEANITGTIYAKSGTFTGTINATSGYFGTSTQGWNIGTSGFVQAAEKTVADEIYIKDSNKSPVNGIPYYYEYSVKQKNVELSHLYFEYQIKITKSSQSYQKQVVQIDFETESQLKTAYGLTSSDSFNMWYTKTLNWCKLATR